MIKRTLSDKLMALSKQFPVVSVTGPRQSGKTTLTRMVFKDFDHISLEDPDEREFALSDPRGFLKRFAGGVILDEIQRAPALLSYIQGIVDKDTSPGRFILTGSQQLHLMDKVSQTLAGRTAMAPVCVGSPAEGPQELGADLTSSPTLFSWCTRLEDG